MLEEKEHGMMKRWNGGTMESWQETDSSTIPTFHPCVFHYSSIPTPCTLNFFLFVTMENHDEHPSI